MQLEFYSLSTILLFDFNLIFLIVSLISSVGVISDFCFLIHGFSSNEFVLQSFLANCYSSMLHFRFLRISSGSRLAYRALKALSATNVISESYARSYNAFI